MSTLDEIEAAAGQLPLEQQQLLLAHLSARLENVAAPKPVSGDPTITLSRRGFPISKGRAPITSQDVADMEAADDMRQ